MSKKYTKQYNKEVMKTGRQANEYYRNALNLLNQYTSDYSGRLDYFTNKLNNRQLDLLSDKYLAENANMLRGSAAFGSNSATDRQITNNAYSQNNYLADVQNKNVQAANQLQMNELTALQNAQNAFQAGTALGSTAASNIDAANNSWLAVLGDSASSAGKVLSAIPTPWTQVAGAALQTGGAAASSAAGKETDMSSVLAANKEGMIAASNEWGSGALADKLTLGSNSNSNTTLSSKIGYNQNNFQGGLSLPSSTKFGTLFNN